MFNLLGLNPTLTCPNCLEHNVYGNGAEAKELACPDCGLQYNPQDYILIDDDESADEADSADCIFITMRRTD